MITQRNQPVRYRPVGEGDIDALTRMLDAATRTYLDRSTDRSETMDRLATPGCHLPTDSFLVPDEHGEVVGFAQVFATPPADVRGFARVHPDARGQGIGTLLAALMTGRAVEVARTLESSRVRFSTTAWAADSAAVPVLRAAGLHEARHFLRMVADLTGSQTSEPQWPEGVVPASYRQGADDAALFDAFTESFSEHWGHEHPDEKGWWWDERDSSSSGFDPSLWTIARMGDEVVGFVLARVLEREGRSEGYVSQIGVRPRWRGKRLGHTLLRYVLWRLRSRGLQTASLDVDAANVTDALRLYRGVGMTEHPAFTIWEADLAEESEL
jgi:mycothiol synthase